MVVNNNATLIRRNLLAKTIELLLKDRTEESDRIPIEMRPRNKEYIRCCIYKDRAVLKYKIMALLGFSDSEETDELKPIGEYFEEMLRTDKYNKELLSVVDEACSSCQSGNHIVTNMCRGCVGRSCMMNCPKDAIDITKGQAVINEDTCVNCGICQKVCPYHAIIYTPVPCEESCPVKAIKKNEAGNERIDESACIACGKCIEACPFGAIVERSHVYHVVQDIKNDIPLVAMVAPSIMGQFKAQLPNILASIKNLGFTEVIEVAEGADLTTQHEAEEWSYKMEEGQSFMTTSCCPSYVNLVNKHIPDLKPYVSETKSPMVFAAERAKREFPNAKVVFVGPCLGKKYEAKNNSLIDYVLNFEELGSWLLALGSEIDTAELSLDRNLAQNDSRAYGVAGGVSNAVRNQLASPEKLKPQLIQGIGKAEFRSLKMISKKPQEFNFLEVMSCERGCVGGCSTLAKSAQAARQIDLVIKSVEPVNSGVCN